MVAVRSESSAASTTATCRGENKLHTRTFNDKDAVSLRVHCSGPGASLVTEWTAANARGRGWYQNTVWAMIGGSQSWSSHTSVISSLEACAQRPMDKNTPSQFRGTQTITGRAREEVSYGSSGLAGALDGGAQVGRHDRLATCALEG
jgi:hypothetical protein